MQSKNNVEWWQEEYGFFGKHYLEGDNSEEGYLIQHKQTLAERTNAEVDGIIQLLQLQSGDRVLDIPCGYGRHSIGLAKKGCKVVGVDINSIHLSKATAAAEKAGIDLEFKKENMIDITYQEEFDGVINMFYSFGFFETDEENFKVLKNFYTTLKEGGKFLFHTDVNIPRILAGKYKEDEVRHLVTGGELRIIDKYNPVTKRIDGSWEIKHTDGSVVNKDYSVRVYEKDEFVEMCKSVGFKKCEAFSDWKGTPYTEDSEDMIIIAQK